MHQVIAERYQLESLIGQGGMASVWRAQDLRLGRAVAVKVLTQGSASDGDSVERFRREAATLARLAHPNIVAVFDADAAGQTPFLVMELVEGQSLSDILKRGPLRIEHALRIADQTAGALAAAHQVGIVHRDIKPANLMLTPAGQVTVLDFGIARLGDSAQVGLTSTSMVVGTAAYMSPEQAVGGQLDARSDLYALGCVLHEMLAGEPPFPGGNQLSALHRHVSEPPPPLRSLRAETPADVETLVLGLLAKDPAARPASATLVQHQLTALLTGEAPRTAAFPTTPGSARTSAAPAVAAPRAGRRPSGGRVRPQPTDRRRSYILIACAGAATLVLSALGANALTSSAAGSDTPPATSSNSPAAAPSTPAQSLSAAQSLVNRLTSASDVSAGTAQQLRHGLENVSSKLRDGDRQAAATAVADLRGKLSKLHSNGQIPDDAATQIDHALGRLAQLLPAAQTD
ncbi:protein kinase [Streptacidiphilus sp. MAP12-20]|uniref:protein kinase domain-containing protein n=1 Tax=Streptacidiphilus sp. MAP12-20 TaxID=3156299 RepID=UPI003515C880